MDALDDVRRKADHAKRMLDEIDELIESDNSMMLDADVMRARSQYSNEWVKLLEVLRKAQTGQQAPEQRKGKLDGIRGQLKVVKAL